MLPWAPQHLFCPWLEGTSRFTKERKLFLSAAVWQPSSHTSKEGVGTKTDQIVAYGHAVIKQPLAYISKSEPSLFSLTLPIDALQLITPSSVTCMYIYSLFFPPWLLTICVLAIAGLARLGQQSPERNSTEERSREKGHWEKKKTIQ